LTPILLLSAAASSFSATASFEVSKDLVPPLAEHARVCVDLHLDEDATCAVAAKIHVSEVIPDPDFTSVEIQILGGEAPPSLCQLVEASEGRSACYVSVLDRVTARDEICLAVGQTPEASSGAKIRANLRAKCDHES